MGWMREHVIRSTGDRRASDIYYFGPDGKKLRSIPDILLYLSKHPDIKLAKENFTFSKELIYREPFEIERGAKQITSIKRPSELTPDKKPSSTPVNKKRCSAPCNGNDASTAPSVKKKVAERSSLPSHQTNLGSKIKKVDLDDSADSSGSKQTNLYRYLTIDTKNTKNKVSLTTDTKSTKNKVSLTTDKSTKNKVSLATDTKSTDDKVSSRSSRTIVKRIPFDNSREIKKTRKPKVTPRSSSVSDNLSNSVNSAASSSSCDINQNELPLDKSADSSKTPKSTPQVHTISERTSEKSSKIKKGLKVKFSRKYTPVLQRPCTRFCNFSQFRVPSVQCSVCLCLFHFECIPYIAADRPIYACGPCVTNQSASFREEYPDVHIPLDIETEMLYPESNVQLYYDPDFDRLFNVFRSPIDISFGQSYGQNYVQNIQSQNSVYPPTPSVPKLNQNPNMGNAKIVYLPRAGGSGSTTLKPLRMVAVSRLAAPSVTSGAVLCNSSTSLQNHHSYATNSRINPSLKPTFLYRGTVPLNASNNIPFAASTSNTQYVHVSGSKIIKITKLPAGTIPMNKPAVNASLDEICADYMQGNTSVLQTLLQSNGNGTYSDCSVSTSTKRKFDSLSGEKIGQKSMRFDNCSATNERNLTDLSSYNLSNNSNGTVLNNFKSVPPFQNIYQPILSSPINSTIPQNFANPNDLQTNNLHSAPVKVATASQNSSSQNITLQQETSTCSNNAPNQTYLQKTTAYGIVSDNSADNSKEESKNFRDYSRGRKAKNAGKYSPSKRKNCAQSSDIPRESGNYSQQDSSLNECLNLMFKYMNVCDLLKACLVCRSWKRLATQKCLWEQVCFTGLSINDWSKCCQALQKYGTKSMDLRGILDQDSLESWKLFSCNVNNLKGIEEIIFEKVPPFVLKDITETLPQLRNLTCYCVTTVFTEPEIWSTPCELDLSSLRNLGRLQKLKISSMGGIILDETSHSFLPYLPNLTHIVLTGFKFHSFMNLECLSHQKQLVSLELGDCSGIKPEFYGLLGRLTNLKSLCLQNGGKINDLKMAEAISKMHRLENLELMNFKVSSHLSAVFKKMDHLSYFSIWPDNSSEAAIVNFNCLSAVISCPNLKGICWGILTNDEEDVPNVLEIRDPNKPVTEVETMTFQDLFKKLTKHFPGKSIEMKCLPRNIWSEFCSSRDFV